MFIYKNGVLWLNGTGKDRNVGYIHRFIIGSNKNLGNNWTGKIDEFRIFNHALSDTVIQNNFNKKLTQNHPFYNNCMVYYDFDNTPYAVDHSHNDFLGADPADICFGFVVPMKHQDLSHHQYCDANL